MARTVGSWIAIMLFGATGLVRGADHPRLRVRIALEFEGPAPSGALARALRRETAAVWERYGVVIAWSGTAACRPADVSVVAVLHRGKATARAYGADLTLGTTWIGGDGVIRGPIAISEPAILAVLAARPVEQLAVTAMFPGGAEMELGRALGRVLAHELGHIVLAAPNHQAAGLMRMRFSSDELTAPNPGPFRLTANDVARLRHRVPILLMTEQADSRNECRPEST